MNANITPGTAVTLTLTDGNTVAGTFISINTKGYNVKTVDGRVVSRSVSRVARMDVYTATVDPFAGLSDDELMTTAALALIFDTNAKALRVQLRKVGLGVGKGHVYGLTPAAVRPLFNHIRDGLAAM